MRTLFTWIAFFLLFFLMLALAVGPFFLPVLTFYLLYRIIPKDRTLITNFLTGPLVQIRERGIGVRVALVGLALVGTILILDGFLYKQEGEVIGGHLLILPALGLLLFLHTRIVISKVRERIQNFKRPEVETINANKEVVQTNHIGKTTPQFIGPDMRVSIGNHVLESPLIYVANAKALHGADASLFCLKSPIGAPRIEPPRFLGYWPHLSELEPHQRGNYLEWLATGRQDPDFDVGYVFIYFYGLERRALIDREDEIAIAREVLRLLSVYRNSRSFQRYATSLIIHLVMTGQIRSANWQKLVTHLLEANRGDVDDEMRQFLLGLLVVQNAPLPPLWAFQMARADERTRTSVVTKRAPEEFERLFMLKFNDRIGNTLIPTKGATESEFHYHAASPSLLSHNPISRRLPVAKWPSTRGWSRQFTPVVQIWNECIDDLKGFARKVKGIKEAESIGLNHAAYQQLPEELKKETDHPLQKQWEELVDANLGDDHTTLVPVGSIASLFGIPPTRKLSTAQSRKMAEGVSELGSAIEPDPRYTKEALNWDNHVAVIKLIDGTTLPEGQGYRLAGLILQLSIEVANADGTIDEDERKAITDYLEERFMLGRNERVRLHAYFDVLEKDGPSLTGLKKGLSESLNVKQLQTLATFLVSVAAATGGIVESEIEALKKTFKTIGLKVDEIADILSTTRSKFPTGPITVSAGSPAAVGEAIPPQEDTASLDLDLEFIAQLRKDTEETTELLSGLLNSSEFNAISETDGSNESISQSPMVQATAGEDLFQLPPELQSIFDAVVLKETWTREAFSELARQWGYTASAALEELNSWALDKFGDIIVEDEDPITVNTQMIAQGGYQK